MTVKIHDLKCWPDEFRALVSGKKRHEFRFNDRNYSEGDLLRICEWSPATETFTGAWTQLRVTYIGAGGFGIPEGFVVMSVVATSALEYTFPDLLTVVEPAKRRLVRVGDYT